MRVGLIAPPCVPVPPRTDGCTGSVIAVVEPTGALDHRAVTGTARAALCAIGDD